MKGLLVKDFRLFSQRKMFFILLLICAAALGTTDSGSVFTIAYFTMITAIFTTSTVSYDEYDNCYPFLFTLPVTRKQYTLEKYIFGFLTGIASDITATVVAVVIALTKGETPGIEILFTAVGVIPLFLVINAFSLPPMLKYGVEKGRICMFIIGALIFVFGNIIMKSGTSSDNISVISENKVLLGTIISAVTVAIVTLSYLISLKIVKNKEV